MIAGNRSSESRFTMLLAAASGIPGPRLECGRGEFRAQQLGVGSLISESTQGGKSYVDGPRRQLASFEMNSVARDDGLVDRRGSEQYQAMNSSMECRYPVATP